jgi:hypothetical protein
MEGAVRSSLRTATNSDHLTTQPNGTKNIENTTGSKAGPFSMPTDRKPPHAQTTPLTKADRWIQAKDRAAVLAQYPEARIPDEKVKHTVTLDEEPQVTADCYTANGVAATVQGGGVLTKIHGAAQDEQAQVVRIICESE